jgi:UDP-N-acetylglucosamine 2-epimerase (non-hydrolysing)
VGAKASIPVIHLEAGLRSGDRTMPEEINRLVTDAIADVYWTPSHDAGEHLRREGVSEERIDFVGNIMLDAFEMLRARIESSDLKERLGVASHRFGVVTLHRPSNVDDPAQLARLVDHLLAVATRLPLVFPVHPRTRHRLDEAGLADRLATGVRLCDPLGYVDFMALVRRSAAVLTDSGGVQEETTYLSIPCLTLRDTTERPITISEGTNRLVRPENLVASVEEVIADRWPRGRCPERWDGRTAARCVMALARRAGV